MSCAGHLAAKLRKSRLRPIILVPLAPVVIWIFWVAWPLYYFSMKKREDSSKLLGEKKNDAEALSQTQSL